MAEHATAIREVPEDPTNPGFDVLRGELGKRTHYIHVAMASGEAMTAAEIGKRAEKLARRGGYQCKATTFAPQTTRSHLVSMRDMPGRGFAEQLPDGRWCLTERAWQLIRDPSSLSRRSPREESASAVRTVDDKGRLLLHKEFANATVTVEQISASEFRVRKAVVIPESELPLVENQLRPLSDRDRDFFLNLIDHPPEPTSALRAAVAKSRKRHG
jgi:hypothetical protein